MRAFKGVFIPADIWLDSTITPLQKMYLMEIYSLDNGNGCFANNSHFARLTGSTPTSAGITLRKMEKQGLISITYEDEVSHRGRKITATHQALRPQSELEPPQAELDPPQTAFAPPQEKFEGYNKETIKTTIKEDIHQSRFLEFWKAYPKKVSKRKCQEKWKSRKLDSIADLIIADVTRKRIDDVQWQDGFIPNPLTYINGDRWEDEIQTKRAVKGAQKPEKKVYSYNESRKIANMYNPDGSLKQRGGGLKRVLS